MILELFILGFLALVTSLGSLLPSFSITTGGITLPFGMDDILLSTFSSIRVLGSFFPPLYTLLIAFSIYIGFLLFIKIIRMIPVIGKFID